jgi:hypothetical protein
MSDSSMFLCAQPSFVEGIARILDFGGTLNQYNQSITADQADYLALRGDWQLIGMDLARVLDKECDRLVGSRAD